MDTIQITVDNQLWSRTIDHDKEPKELIEDVTALLDAVREYCLLSIAGLLPSSQDGNRGES